jgi:hypothetical protein
MEQEYNQKLITLETEMERKFETEKLSLMQRMKEYENKKKEEF